MKNHLLVPNFNTKSTQARIKAAHHALGSYITDVAMPDVVRINPGSNQLFSGAFSGLNDPEFTRLGINFCLAKNGYVTRKETRNGNLYVKVAVPVYSSMQKGYKGMLFVKLATVGQDLLGTQIAVKVEPLIWASAVTDGSNHWVTELKPAETSQECNPFDYAQAFLPVSLKQAGVHECISAASLCEFLSEVFRFLNPEDRALYLEIMVQGNRFTKFLNYAASTRSHHNCEHGLLLHTAETVAHVLLKALATTPEERASSKPPFDLSLTLLAALLHDAAKVDEYYRLAPDVYSSNLNCELLGHEQTMLKWIAVACSVSGCYPTDRELQLEHAICAVKKQHDQSGARKRKTPESFVLHEADCASARAFDKSETSVLLTHQFVQGETA